MGWGYGAKDEREGTEKRVVCVHHALRFLQKKKKINRPEKYALKMSIQLVVAMNSPRLKNYRTRLNGIRSSWTGIFSLAGF